MTSICCCSGCTIMSRMRTERPVSVVCAACCPPAAPRFFDSMRCFSAAVWRCHSSLCECNSSRRSRISCGPPHQWSARGTTRQARCEQRLAFFDRWPASLELRCCPVALAARRCTRPCSCTMCRRVCRPGCGGGHHTSACLSKHLHGVLAYLPQLLLTAMLILAACEEARASWTVDAIAFGAFQRPISGTQGIRRFA